MSSPSEMKTPPRTPKKKSNVSNRSIGGLASPIMSPTYTPDGWECKRVFLVYQKPKDESVRINVVPGRNQGVWTEGYVATQSPQEVWVFSNENVPASLLEEQPGQPTKRKQHIHGVWGLKPGGDESDPNDVWFYPPDYTTGKNDHRVDAKPLPRYFTPRGIWTFPLVKRNVSEIAPEMTGWLGLGETAKLEKLDVAGTWKMMYRQDGLPVESKGPGMKPRTPKSTPTTTPKKSPKRLETMKIVVETLDGTTIPLTVLPTDTVDTVKERVWNEENIPKADQRLLSPSGKLMDEDQKTLKAYGICDGNTIRLDGIKVFVKQLWDGRTFELSSLRLDATIGSLKDKIQNQEDIDRTDQLLSFDDELLKDKLTLRDYKIQHGDTLELEEMEVTVAHFDREFTISVTPRDTIKEVKRKIERQEDIPSDYLRLEFLGEPLDQDSFTLKDYKVPHQGRLELQPLELVIRKPSGEKFPLLVTPTHTIHEVKEKILAVQSIPVNEQRLLYGSEHLKDHRTLQEYGVHHGDALDLEGMTIYVRHWKNKTKKYALDRLTHSTAIKDLKEMLEDRYGLPKRDIRLRFGGDALDDDQKTLREHGILHESTLDLEAMQVLVVTPEGTEVCIYVEPKDTVGELKHRVEINHGIPVDEQRLLFGGKVLDDRSTLADNNIKHGSTLNMEAMEIFVKQLDGTQFRLEVDPLLTINDVKNKIEAKTGLARDTQRLTLHGGLLEDGHESLRGYKIKHQDVLELEPMTINVRTPDGRNISLSVEIMDTIGRLKTKIEQETQIPPEHQRLEHDQRNLNNDKKTLRDYKIKHGSTLIMKPMVIQIQTSDGRNISLQVEPNDNIASVKGQIEENEGIRPEDQRLLWNGKELDDRKTLSDYGIQHGTTLALGGMQIHIKHFNGNTLTLPVVATNSVSDVKVMVQESEGTPVDHQHFLFGTTLLDDDSRTLSEYNIKNGATLKLEGMKVSVVTPSGKFLLSVEPSTTIHALKDMVQKKTTLVPKDQIIKFQGENLSSDDATLQECHVKHRDTINVDVADPLMYNTVLGPYQSAFSYSPSPKKKREGVRSRKTYNAVGDFYATTLTDREIGQWTHKTTDES